MENMYQVPFERFEKYSPYGNPAEVADFLAPYVEAGCRTFHLVPVCEDDAASVELCGKVKRLLSA